MYNASSKVAYDMGTMKKPQQELNEKQAKELAVGLGAGMAVGLAIGLSYGNMPD
jgi:hypothetical protein